MTRFVDRLEAAGLVRREAVPGDRRGAYAVITKDGTDLLRRMWPIYARGIATYFGPALAAEGDARATFEAIAAAAAAPASTTKP
jgi:DNA-binding MarR family transcriptional regulator